MGINIKQLKKGLTRFLRPIDETMEKFEKYRELYFVENPKSKVDDVQQYWHIKRQKANVLLVAHVDTVQTPKLNAVIDDRIYAAGLDDRLGVFLAMYIASKRKDVDVLITDDEEIGDSTAALVPTEDLQKYRMIIELDRAGDDFVDYDLACNQLIVEMPKSRKLSYGSFSDICFLNNPPCSCINIGIGYYEAHSKYSYCVLDEVNKAVKDINRLITTTVGTFFPAPPPKKYKNSSYYSGNSKVFGSSGYEVNDDYWNSDYDGGFEAEKWEDALYWLQLADIAAEDYGMSATDMGADFQIAEECLKAKVTPEEWISVQAAKNAIIKIDTKDHFNIDGGWKGHFDG